MANVTLTAAQVSADQNHGSITKMYKAAASATLVVGQVVAPDGLVNSVSGLPTVVLADGDNASFQIAEAVGIVVNSTDWYGGTTIAATQNAEVCIFGPVYMPGANLVPGAIYYVSDTAGAISDTVSSTHGWVIGQAIDADTLFVTPRGTGSGSY